MPAVTTSIEISARPDAVWEVALDPRRLGDWVTIHRRLGAVSELPVRTGTTMEQTLAIAGVPFKVHWTATEVDAPRHVVWEGEGPAHSHARTSYRLTPARNGGTRFEYENEFRAPGGPLGRVAGRVLVGGVSRHEANASLKRLKRLLER